MSRPVVDGSFIQNGMKPGQSKPSVAPNEGTLAAIGTYINPQNRNPLHHLTQRIDVKRGTITRRRSSLFGAVKAKIFRKLEDIALRSAQAADFPSPVI
jgi:hypothetical protein